MAKNNISLFWQLYLGISASLLVVVGLFFILYMYLQVSTQEDDFYRDVERVAEVVMFQPEEHIKPEELEHIGEEFGFKVRYLPKAVLSAVVADFEALGSIKAAQLYQNREHGHLMAVWDWPYDPLYILVVQDLDPEDEELHPDFQDMFERENHQEVRQEFILKLLVVSILMGLGALLLFLVRRISRYFRHFAQVCQQWGQGKFDLRANEDVPEPIGELAQQLNLMADSLERAEQEKAVIMHGVSHELRTPLSALNLAMGLLARQYPQLASEPLLENMQHYSDQMETLVNQSLTLAKASYEHQVNFEEVDIKRLLVERCEELEKLHENKALNLALSESCIVQGNGFDLQIALDNLISNGLKYSQSQVRVSLRLGQATVNIAVEDDGPGVPECERERLFMPFARVDGSRHRDTGGFGLGLAITRAMVSNHSGSIGLSDSELGGLKVEISLPLTQSYTR